MQIESIVRLVLQIQFVILPILLFQQPFIYQYKKNLPHFQKVKMTVMLAVSMYLCMTFRVEGVIEGLVFDLRLVPLTLAFLYVGIPSGALLAFGVSLYRWIIGGSWLPAVGVTVSCALLVSLLASFFRKASYPRKILLAVGIMFAVSFLRVVFYFISVPEANLFGKSTIIFLLYLPLIQSVTFFFAIFVIESFMDKERLEQTVVGAERISMIGQLSAAIAHEVRNPLTAVKGFLQLLKSEGLPEGKRKEYLRIAEEEINRADGIIHDYLSLARPQPTKMADIVVADQLKAAALTMSSYALLHNVTLVHGDLDRSIVVRGDAAKLSQVLVNILKNGIEATSTVPGKKTVTVRTCAENGFARIEIEDSGVGIPKETLEKLGMAFFTGKEQGTGLGLMVCYQMVAAMNGSIDVDSEPGRGTTFIIKIPL